MYSIPLDKIRGMIFSAENVVTASKLRAVCVHLKCKYAVYIMHCSDNYNDDE